MARTGNHPRKINVPGAAALPQAASSRKASRLQDAVYREMYLLEASKPGAEMGLALALLHAVVESEQTTDHEEIRVWLKSVCPLCLQMIESALNFRCAGTADMKQ
jgi:hypothetical protein